MGRRRGWGEWTAFGIEVYDLGMKRKINLRDPEFEPTDEELAELMHSAFAGVRAEREARERAVADEIAARVAKRWMEQGAKPGQP